MGRERVVIYGNWRIKRKGAKMNKIIKGLVIAAVAVLTGCCSGDCGCARGRELPNERIVKAMNASRYDGWYTLENAVSGADVYTETVRQVAVLKLWPTEAGENHL